MINDCWPLIEDYWIEAEMVSVDFTGLRVLFSGRSVKEEAITRFTHAFSRLDKRCICSWKVFLIFLQVQV